MQNRINIPALDAQSYQFIAALDAHLQKSDLSKIHLELIKIRASQINKCAFCLNMHTTDALKNGETAQRIFLLNAWQETDLFNEEERVILMMTEEITLISNHGLSDAVYKKAEAIFSEKYIAQIIMAIVTINAWNRIAISTNLPV